MGKVSRAICHLVGCVCAESYPACHRCGTDLYDADFVQVARLQFAFDAYWNARKLVWKLTGKKCEACGRRFWRGYDEWICSDECFTDWLPF